MIVYKYGAVLKVLYCYCFLLSSSLFCFFFFLSITMKSVAQKLRLAAKRKAAAADLAEGSQAKVTSRAKIGSSEGVRQEETSAIPSTAVPSPTVPFTKETSQKATEPSSKPFGSTLSEAQAKTVVAESFQSLPSLGSISERGFDFTHTEKTSSMVKTIEGVAADVVESAARTTVMVSSTAEIVELNSPEGSAAQANISASGSEAEILGVRETLTEASTRISALEEVLKRSQEDERAGEGQAQKEGNIAEGPSFDLLSEKEISDSRGHLPQEEENVEVNTQPSSTGIALTKEGAVGEEGLPIDTSIPPADVDIQGQAMDIDIANPTVELGTTLAIPVTREDTPANTSIRKEPAAGASSSAPT